MREYPSEQRSPLKSLSFFSSHGVKTGGGIDRRVSLFVVKVNKKLQCLVCLKICCAKDKLGTSQRSAAILGHRLGGVKLNVFFSHHIRRSSLGNGRGRPGF